MMNKKGQFDLDFSEIIGLIVLGVFLLITIPIITVILNAAVSGDIENSLSAIIGVFIPLFIFAIFFEQRKKFSYDIRKTN